MPATDNNDIEILISSDSGGLYEGIMDATKVLTKFDEVIKAVQNSTRDLSKQFENMVAATSGIKSIDSTLKTLGTSLKNVVLETQGVKRAIAGSGKTMSKEFKEANASIKTLGNDVKASFKTAIASANNDAKKLVTGLDGVKKAVKDTDAGFSKINNTLGNFRSKVNGSFNSLEATVKSSTRSVRDSVYNVNLAVGQLEKTMIRLAGVSGRSMRKVITELEAGNRLVYKLNTPLTQLVNKMAQVETHLVHVARNTSNTYGAIRALETTVKGLSGSFSKQATSAATAATGINATGNAATKATSKLHTMSKSLNHLQGAMIFLSTYAMAIPRHIIDAVAEFEKLETLTRGMRTKEFSNATRYETNGNGELTTRPATQAEKDFMTNSFAAGDTKFIYDMAKKAPFQLGAIQDAFVKLRVGGVEPLDGSLQILLDSVAKFGGDSEILKRAAIAIQQMGGKGVVSMEELRQQLGEAIPDAMQAMADGLGWSMEKLAKEISLAHVDAQTGITAMLIELDKRNRGASEKFMQTWTGKIAKLKTTVDMFFIDLAKGDFMGGLKGTVDDLTTTLASKEFQSFARSVGSAFSAIAAGLGGALKLAIQFKDVILAAGGLWLFKSGVSWAWEFGSAMATKGKETLAWWTQVFDRMKQARKDLPQLEAQRQTLQNQINPPAGSIQPALQGQALIDAQNQLKNLDAQIKSTQQSSSFLGSVWQGLTGGAINLKGAILGVGVALGSMLGQMLIAWAVGQAFMVLKGIWDDISGKTAKDLEDALRRIKEGAGSEEDYKKICESWENQRQVIENYRLSMQGLSEDTAEYAAQREHLNELEKEHEETDYAKSKYEAAERARNLQQEFQQEQKELLNLIVQIQAAHASGQTELENQLRAQFEKDHQIFLARLNGAYEQVSEGYLSATDAATREWYATMKTMLDGLIQSSLNSFTKLGIEGIKGKLATNIVGSLDDVIKKYNVEVVRPRPSAGLGGGSKKKGGFGRGRKRGAGGGGGHHDSTGDWIKDLQSQAMILQAENESLMEGLNTLDDINKKAELLVKQRNKDGKMSKKQLEDAKNAEIALLKQKTANELLKRATDDLNASQEDLKWSSLETEKGYGKLSNGVKSLLKQYAKLERKMGMLKDKDGNEMKELGVVRDRLNQSIMSKIAAEAVEMGKDVKKDIDQLQIGWITDTADRRQAQIAFAVSVAEDEYKAQVKLFDEKLELYKNDAEKYKEYQALKAKVTEAYQEKIRLAELKAREAAMTANEKQEAEWADVTKQMEDASKNWASSFTDNIQTALEGGKVNWRSFLSSMLSDMNKILIQKAFGGAINQMFDSIGKSSADWINGIAGASIAGARSKQQIIGAGGADTAFSDSVKKIMEQIQNAGNTLSNGVTKTVDTMTQGSQSWFDSVIQIGQNAYNSIRDMLGGLGKTLVEFAGMIMQGIGTGASAVGGWFTGLFSFADGGIMTGKGALPLKAYAGGGIANSPQLAMFGEGARPEAFVPLPDGRSIPVTLTNDRNAGGNYTPVSISIHVENNGSSAQTTSNSSGDSSQNKMWSELANKIKGMVVEEINTQKRPGGVLYG